MEERKIRSLRSVRIKVTKVIKVIKVTKVIKDVKDVKDVKDFSDLNDLSDIVLLFQKKLRGGAAFLVGSGCFSLFLVGRLFAEEGSGVFAGGVEGGEFFHYSGTVGCVGYAEPA